MLCFVVLNVAVSRKNQGNGYYGLAIGFVIVAGAYGAGAVSGGCFNPAVAWGIDVASIPIGGFKHCLMYTVFEFAGAILATVLFWVCRPDDQPRDDGEQRPEKLPLAFETRQRVHRHIHVDLDCWFECSGRFGSSRLLHRRVFDVHDLCTGVLFWSTFQPCSDSRHRHVWTGHSEADRGSSIYGRTDFRRMLCSVYVLLSEERPIVRTQASNLYIRRGPSCRVFVHICISIRRLVSCHIEGCPYPIFRFSDRHVCNSRRLRHWQNLRRFVEPLSPLA